MDRVRSNLCFCSGGCAEVYAGLQSCTGLSNQIADGFSWALLRCIHDDQKVHSAQWFALKAECNSELAVVLTIMEECFLSMVDPRTGIDIIPQVVYNWGSNFARLNCLGFYTVVLEKDDVLISVASIRVHGILVAEMPLIATCSRYRRQGMCRRLLSSIEKMLISLKVRKLIITAIHSLVETWTVGFGFVPMQGDEKRSLNKTNLMVFPGTVMLRKSLYGDETADSEKINAGESGWRTDEAAKEAAFGRESKLEVEMAKNTLMEAAAEAESNLGSLASEGNDEKRPNGTVSDELVECSNMRADVGKESDEAALHCWAGQTAESVGSMALEIDGDGSVSEVSLKSEVELSTIYPIDDIELDHEKCEDQEIVKAATAVGVCPSSQANEAVDGGAVTEIPLLECRDSETGEVKETMEDDLAAEEKVTVGVSVEPASEFVDRVKPQEGQTIDGGGRVTANALLGRWDSTTDEIEVKVTTEDDSADSTVAQEKVVVEAAVERESELVDCEEPLEGETIDETGMATGTAFLRCWDSETVEVKERMKDNLAALTVAEEEAADGAAMEPGSELVDRAEPLEGEAIDEAGMVAGNALLESPDSETGEVKEMMEDDSVALTVVEEKAAVEAAMETQSEFVDRAELPEGETMDQGTKTSGESLRNWLANLMLENSSPPSNGHGKPVFLRDCYP